MQRYYEETKLGNEIYPWQVIFDDRTSSISRMFREVEAQHHLAQPLGKDGERPDIPGLTPKGFETWAILLIKAHPDLEFERLAKTALDMPISNPDDKKEALPKRDLKEIVSQARRRVCVFQIAEIDVGALQRLLQDSWRQHRRDSIQCQRH